jgi:hypothetical protein
VHELAVTDRLEALARDAAERLRELVAAGEELPFEVTGPGEDSPFSQYAPQTGRFVREHWAELAELDSFSEACAAIGAAELAGPYLEQLDEPVPPDEDRRSEAAAITFLSRVWDGSSDFTLDGARLPDALRELEGCVESPAEGDAEVVAPLLGFHMPSVRLALEETTLIRADVVEVPDEMRRSEGAGRGAWEPQFLAVVRGSVPASEDPESIPGGSAAVAPGAALRELVTTLRLFKAGGVGLGPYAWARAPGDRWRRLATGAARPRPGGYRLTDTDLGDLAALSRAVANRSAGLGGFAPERPNAAGTLARAVSRFEAGLERPAQLEALSDYVLALRYLLEGGGVADVGLAMRVAAICAEAGERPAIKAQVERALALEQALMRGELPPAGEGEGPLDLVAAVEERTRWILRDAASGRLGVDLRAMADEALLADGLAVGEGAAETRGETAEWGAVELTEPPPAPDPVAPDPAGPQPTSNPVAPARDPSARVTARHPGSLAEDATGMDLEEIGSEQPTSVLMATKATKRQHREVPEESRESSDWLSEVDARGDTLEWPERPEALKLLDQRPAEREAARRRVRHLFPRPEATEWGVAELQYDRRRRRARV